MFKNIKLQYEYKYKYIYIIYSRTFKVDTSLQNWIETQKII